MASIRTGLWALRAKSLPAPVSIRACAYSTTSSFTTPNSQSSVNPTEVSHFNALASSWWDAHGPSRLLHLMNPLRHDFIQGCHASQPKAPLKPLRYLDVGCGGGIFAESAARLRDTASVTAIDPSSEVLAVARQHARRDPVLQEPRLRYVNCSIEQLPIPQTIEEQYDVLTLFEVIEHVQYPAEFLRLCAPFVKPGGWIIMSTIARTYTSWLTTKVVAEDMLRIVPRGTHDWAKYINEEELRSWFLADIDAQGQGWNSPRVMGVVYVPGLGWKQVAGSERIGNYFFGIRRDQVT